jgi:hypothetical protein
LGGILSFMFAICFFGSDCFMSLPRPDFELLPIFGQILGRFRLLLGPVDRVGEVGNGGRLSAMGSVWATVVAEGDPVPDAGTSLRSGFPIVLVDAFKDR